MKPDQTQQSSPQMDPNALAATLAHATHLHEQLLPDKQAPESPVEPQDAPQQEKTPEPDIMAEIKKMGDSLLQEIESIKKDSSKPNDTQKEIDAIREELDKLEQHG